MEEDLIELLMPKFNITKEYADPELILFYKNLSNNEFWIDEEICWKNQGFLIKYIKMLNSLCEDPTKEKPIILHINSYGGEIDTMFSLYDTIKNSKIPVYTINEGVSCSAAFIIYLAGSKRTMLPNSYFVAHEGYGGTNGSFKESKAAMVQHEKEVDKMAEIFAEATNLTLEDIKNHYNTESDWYIRYDEAKDCGIITE